MKKFIFGTIFSFFTLNFAHAEELKKIVWKIDSQHTQAIQNWNIFAFNELVEKPQVKESELIDKINKINHLMTKETNIIPLSVCVFSDALVIKSIDTNCD